MGLYHDLDTLIFVKGESQQTLQDAQADHLTNSNVVPPSETIEGDDGTQTLSTMALQRPLSDEQVAQELSVQSGSTLGGKLRIFSLPFRFKPKKRGRSEDSSNENAKTSPSAIADKAYAVELLDALHSNGLDPNFREQSEGKTAPYQNIGLSGEKPVNEICRLAHDPEHSASRSLVSSHIPSAKGKQSVRIVSQAYSDVYGSKGNIDDSSAGPAGSFNTIGEVRRSNQILPHLV